MRHYPVFLDLRDRRVVVAGAGPVAVAKLRLLMKTEAAIAVYGERPPAAGPRLGGGGADRASPSASRGGGRRPARRWSTAPPATRRPMRGSRRSPGRPGVLVNIVDNLDDSDFITPAIVDRDPVTVAIGTEGAAPVLARKIKAEVEAMLPATLGRLTRIGQGFRHRVEALDSRARRLFWTRFYFERGPRALEAGEDAARDELEQMLAEGVAARRGVVYLVGTGPGDPELMTLKARRLLHGADVVIHDRLVPRRSSSSPGARR